MPIQITHKHPSNHPPPTSTSTCEQVAKLADVHCGLAQLQAMDIRTLHMFNTDVLAREEKAMDAVRARLEAMDATLSTLSK